MAKAKRKPDSPPPPKRGRPRLDAEIRQAIADHLRDNPDAKRNETAARFGVSPSTVTVIARETGRTFDRTKTETATEARRIDVEARGVALVERMVEKAHELYDTWDQPYLVYNFGGRENEYNEHELETPPIEVRQKIATIAAISVDKLLKIRKETKSGAAPASAFEAFMRMIGGEDPGYSDGDTIADEAG